MNHGHEPLPLAAELLSQVERLRSELDATQGQSKLMEQLKGQLTILAISHNRAMVQAADYVYQMEGGSARLLDEQDQSILIK